MEQFNQANIAAFLTSRGVSPLQVSSFSSNVISAAHSRTVRGVISSQNLSEDQMTYTVEVAAQGGNGYAIVYKRTKVGGSFFLDTITVSGAEVSYTTSHYVYEEEASAPVAAAAPVEVVEAEVSASVEVAEVPEVAEVAVEAPAEVAVEAPAEVAVEAPAEVPEVAEVAVEAPAEVAAVTEEPKKKKAATKKTTKAKKAVK